MFVILDFDCSVFRDNFGRPAVFDSEAAAEDFIDKFNLSRRTNTIVQCSFYSLSLRLVNE